MPLNDYSRTLGVLQRMMVKYTKMRKMVAIFIENPDLLPIKTCHDTTKIRDIMAQNGLDITNNTIVTYMKTLGIKKNSHTISDSNLNKLHRFKQQVLEMKQQVIEEHDRALEENTEDIDELPIWI